MNVVAALRSPNILPKQNLIALQCCTAGGLQALQSVDGAQGPDRQGHPGCTPAHRAVLPTDGAAIPLR